MQQTEHPAPPSMVPICFSCGSANVMRNAWAVWNVVTQSWELGTSFDNSKCDDCGAEMAWLEWVDIPTLRKRTMRRLNDQLRRGDPAPHDTIVVTQGVQCLPVDIIVKVILAVQSFDDFTEDNDPYGQHDCAALEVEGHRVFFKIDYYDPALDEQPAELTDPVAIARVLTIMLASEY